VRGECFFDNLKVENR